MTSNTTTQLHQVVVQTLPKQAKGIHSVWTQRLFTIVLHFALVYIGSPNLHINTHTHTHTSLIYHQHGNGHTTRPQYHNWLIHWPQCRKQTRVIPLHTNGSGDAGSSCCRNHISRLVGRMLHLLLLSAEKIERRGRSDRGQSGPHVPRYRTDGAVSQRHDVQRVQRECIIKKKSKAECLWFRYDQRNEWLFWTSFCL